jgi:hypothetical protein
MALLQRISVMFIMCALGTSLAKESPLLSEVSLLQQGEGPTGMIKAASGLCMNGYDRTNAQTLVHVWSCELRDGVNARNTLWDYDSEMGTIRNHYGICLDASKRTTIGTQVMMNTCDANSPDQQWDIDTATNQIKNRHGLCLYSGEDTEGRVELATCNTANSGQHWTFVAVSTDAGEGGQPHDCQTTDWSEFTECSAQ